MKIVVARERAQTAALLRTNQVDVLSQFDTQYALALAAGAKLRMRDNRDIERPPSNNFIAQEETLANKRAEATAIADDIRTIQARTKNWRLEVDSVTQSGENAEANYDACIDFLIDQGVVKQKVPARERVTNALIQDINNFDPLAIQAQAKAYK